MRKLLLGFFLCWCALVAKAQIQADPAHWAYALKKISGNTYEVHLRCQIDSPWHIYAQKQTKDFIGTTTKISFVRQPGLTLIGAPMEHGKKDTYKEASVGILNYEYAGTVDFVQKVTIGPGVQVVKGSIAYQTCTHDHCLKATSVDFSIPVK